MSRGGENIEKYDNQVLYKIDELIEGRFKIRWDEATFLVNDVYFNKDKTGAIYGSDGVWLIEYSVSYWN